MFYILPFVSAFLLSCIITPFIKNIAQKYNIVDQPDGDRKIHIKSTPLLGGVSIFFVQSLLIIIYLYSGFLTDIKISQRFIYSILIGSFILFIGGFLDDKYNLKPRYQIFFSCVAVMTVISSGMQINFVTSPYGGVFLIPKYLALILTFFWLLGIMYTTKLLDGLDGLVSGITVIGSLIIFLVSLFWDQPYSGTSILALILAGGCLGFLIFNFYPAKIFLGEGGSLYLGFMLGVLSIISGSKIATTLLLMALPIIDTLWIIIKRLKSKKPIYIGDRTHLHYQLMELGISQKGVVLIFYCITAFFGLISLFLDTKGKIIVLVLSLIVFSIIVANLKFHGTKNILKIL